jgi:hypothetical protein
MMFLYVGTSSITLSPLALFEPMTDVFLDQALNKHDEWMRTLVLSTCQPYVIQDQ